MQTYHSVDFRKCAKTSRAHLPYHGFSNTVLRKGSRGTLIEQLIDGMVHLKKVCLRVINSICGNNAGALWEKQ